jgi:hypothetical protein
MKIKITKLENELLNDIMLGENDGIGMGYSEYDGLDISNEQKGVLGSLLKKGLVYDSNEGNTNDFDYLPMYCTNFNGKKLEGFKLLTDYIEDPQNILDTI